MLYDTHGPHYSRLLMPVLFITRAPSTPRLGGVTCVEDEMRSEEEGIKGEEREGDGEKKIRRKDEEDKRTGEGRRGERKRNRG